MGQLGPAFQPVNVCEGTLLDPGGEGDYLFDSSTYQVICPEDSGYKISLTFESFATETNVDILRIYEGLDPTSSPPIAVLSDTLDDEFVFTPITFGETCLTLHFITNGTVPGPGFEAQINCIELPPAFIMGADSAVTINSCSGFILDPGGEDFYPINDTTIQTICSDSGQCIKLDFEAFDTEYSIDILNVYDGPDTGSDFIAQYSGPPPEFSYQMWGFESSESCVTLEFISDSNVTSEAGFIGLISCKECEPAPLVIGNDSLVYTCNLVLLDPGGYGNYPENSYEIQTICSDSNECIRVHFVDFNTGFLDLLTVYDGADTNATILATLRGGSNYITHTLESSLNSNGCMTFKFESDSISSVYHRGFTGVISCTPCQEMNYIESFYICESAIDFCSGGEVQFSANSELTSNPYSEFGCLGSNIPFYYPSWFTIEIAESGDLELLIEATSDIDFICWGPFTEIEIQSGICNIISNEAWAGDASNIADCSFSGSSTEICTIDSAQLGSIYLLMVNNYSRQPQVISLSKNAGEGNSGCHPACGFETLTEVSACDSSTNTYSINGTIEVPNDYPFDYILVTSSSGGTQMLDNLLDDTLTFAFTNLPSTGIEETIQVYIAGNSFCASSYNYLAPSSCSECSVVIESDNTFCPGTDTELTAISNLNGVYSWQGPNGLESDDQTLQLYDISFENAGSYFMLFTDSSGECTSQASLELYVNPIIQYNPIINFEQNAICLGDSIIVNISPYNNSYDYTWTGPEAFTANRSAFIISPSEFQNEGVYYFSVEYLGCSIYADSIQIEVAANPPIPSVSYNSISGMLSTDAETETINWYFTPNLLPIAEAADSVLLYPEYSGSYFAEAVNEFGCATLSPPLIINVTSIQSIEQLNEISFSPNPANSIVNFISSNTGTLVIRDISGRLIKSLTIESESGIISTSDLSEGIYYFDFQTNNSRQLTPVVVLK